MRQRISCFLADVMSLIKNGLPLGISRKSDPCNLAICAIFKNEAAYLKEWIEFHRIIGVQRFYLYNNGSTDHYLDVLAPYIKSKIVSLKEWPMKKSATWLKTQCGAYNHALKLTKRTVNWLAFIDTDEFLFPISGNDLNAFLKEYEDFGGVCINWQMYGTAYAPSIPDHALLIEKLCRKASLKHYENYHVKSVVQPKRVLFFSNPHFCQYRSPYFQVNADKQKFGGPVSPYVAVDKIRINHYWSRDEQFFKSEKIKRRMRRGESPVTWNRRLEYLNAEEDDEKAILRFAERLRQVIKTSDIEIS